MITFKIKYTHIIMAFLLIAGCATASFTIIKFSDRGYHFCTPEEVPGEQTINDKQIPSYVGKACYNYCEGYKWLNQSSCRNNKWKADIKVLYIQKDYDLFMQNDYQIIPFHMLD